MIRSIIKRDGRVVLYDQNKIAAAILKALEAAGVSVEEQERLIEKMLKYRAGDV